jgi:NTE family protein
MNAADTSSTRRPAYAIFAGGGSKGVVLVGCLAAAQEFGFDFLGYAGTSAGSIISLLACVGYSGQELRTVLEHHPVP